MLLYLLRSLQHRSPSLSLRVRSCSSLPIVQKSSGGRACGRSAPCGVTFIAGMECKSPTDEADEDALSPFPHQVAGHKTSLIRYKNKYVMKSNTKPELFQRERKFYESISGDSKQLSFIPEYFGVLSCTSTMSSVCSEEKEYLLLEDLTLCFNNPNVIDIKIGLQTYEPGASAQKILSETTKYPPQATVGFRISGFKVYDTIEGKYTTFDKSYGRSLLTKPKIISGLSRCFPRHRHVLRSVIQQLETNVLLWVKSQQQEFCFYSSSILIIYSSDSTDDIIGDCVPKQNFSPLVAVNMIDFSHVVAVADDPDRNNSYITGIVSLIAQLRLVLSSEGGDVEKDMNDDNTTGGGASPS